MLATMIGHELRTLARSPGLLAVLALLVAALLFGAWAGGRHVLRTERGAAAASAFEEGQRAGMLADVIAYEAEIRAAGGKLKFAEIDHSSESGKRAKAAREGAGSRGGPPAGAMMEGGGGPRQPGSAPQGVNAGAVGSETRAFAVLPPTGLAALAIGQSDILPSYVPVTMRSVLDSLNHVEIDNPVNLRTGSFDVAFVIVFLLPIFILALAYDLLSSEKERGTLALVLAQPIHLRQLLQSKLVTFTLVLVLVVIGSGALAVLTVGRELGSAETWARFALWSGATLLYATFWLALAVLVNLHGRSSAANGVVLASVWLALVVVMPALVNLAASVAYPMPSRMELTVAAREAQTAAEKSRSRALDEYYYDHLELVPDAERRARDFLTLSLANQAAVEKAVRPLLERFERQRDRQESLVRRFQFLSPAIMVQLALNDASGTSAARHRHFMRQVEAFQGKWRDFFAARLLARRPLTSADYARIPRFRYEPEPLAAPLERAAPGLAGLAIAVLLLLVASRSGLRAFEAARA